MRHELGGAGTPNFWHQHSLFRTASGPTGMAWNPKDWHTNSCKSGLFINSIDFDTQPPTPRLVGNLGIYPSCEGRGFTLRVRDCHERRGRKTVGFIDQHLKDSLVESASSIWRSSSVKEERGKLATNQPTNKHANHWLHQINYITSCPNAVHNILCIGKALHRTMLLNYTWKGPN